LRSIGTKTILIAPISWPNTHWNPALFNPSIVPHPDQTGLPSGPAICPQLARHREGHISSITFRAGIITRPADRDNTGQGLSDRAASDSNPLYEKALFGRKLSELA